MLADAILTGQSVCRASARRCRFDADRDALGMRVCPLERDVRLWCPPRIVATIRMMRFIRRVVSFSTAVAAVYALFVRQNLIRWGATEDELHSDYPGADIVENGVRAATMAVTIDAPPSEVWPWLIQMGYDHAGWYSWDRLEMVGARVPPSCIPNGSSSRPATT